MSAYIGWHHTSTCFPSRDQTLGAREQEARRLHELVLS
jgi:hypothetical protein